MGRHWMGFLYESSFMLHHLDDAERARALGEVRRVLRPGGQLHIADVDVAAGHGRFAAGNAGQVLTALRAAGLTEVTHDGGGRIPLLGRFAFYRAATTPIASQ
jgi:SAM-dependent methyltransferase